jgi:hypothetical protein
MVPGTELCLRPEGDIVRVPEPLQINLSRGNRDRIVFVVQRVTRVDISLRELPLLRWIDLPEPFRLIPYPKKGAILRHYTVPSVRDQVAFTAFAVLLAPILES